MTQNLEMFNLCPQYFKIVRRGFVLGTPSVILLECVQFSGVAAPRLVVCGRVHFVFQLTPLTALTTVGENAHESVPNGLDETKSSHPEKGWLSGDKVGVS